MHYFATPYVLPYDSTGALAWLDLWDACPLIRQYLIGVALGYFDD